MSIKTLSSQAWGNSSNLKRTGTYNYRKRTISCWAPFCSMNSFQSRLERSPSAMSVATNRKCLNSGKVFRWNNSKSKIYNKNTKNSGPFNSPPISKIAIVSLLKSLNMRPSSSNLFNKKNPIPIKMLIKSITYFCNSLLKNKPLKRSKKIKPQKPVQSLTSGQIWSLCPISLHMVHWIRKKLIFSFWSFT